MTFTETDSLTERQKRQIVVLWNEEYPEKLSFSKSEEFGQYLESVSERHHILLIDENHIVKGWLMHFIRNNEKWFVMLLDSKLQGKKLGSKLLALAKKRTSELNGWVIDHDNELKQNGESYRSPVGFYEKNGFSILSDIELELKDIHGIKVKWEKNNRS